MMNTQRRATASYVAQPNTPETDAMPKVRHIVEGHTVVDRRDWAVYVMASCPMGAIDMVNAMSDAEFAMLARATPRE